MKNNLDTIERLKENDYGLAVLLKHLEDRWRVNVDFGNILNDIEYLDNDLQIVALDLIVYNIESIDKLDILGLLKIYRKHGMFSLANEVLSEIVENEKAQNFKEWDKNIKKNSLKAFNRLSKIVDYNTEVKSRYFDLKINNQKRLVDFSCKLAHVSTLGINYIRFGYDFIEIGCIGKGRQLYFMIDFRDASISLRFVSKEDLEYIASSPIITIDLPRFEAGTNNIVI